MFGKQSLVGRNDVFAMFDGLEHKGSGRLVTADQLDYNVYFRIGQNLHGIGGQNTRLDLNAAIGGDIEISHAFQLQPCAEPLCHDFGIVLKYPYHPGADGAEAQKTNVNFFHTHSK
jgi:hypothetical protein